MSSLRLRVLRRRKPSNVAYHLKLICTPNIQHPASRRLRMQVPNSPPNSSSWSTARRSISLKLVHLRLTRSCPRKRRRDDSWRGRQATHRSTRLSLQQKRARSFARRKRRRHSRMPLRKSWSLRRLRVARTTLPYSDFWKGRGSSAHPQPWSKPAGSDGSSLLALPLVDTG